MVIEFNDQNLSASKNDCVSPLIKKNAMETLYMCLNFQQRKEGKLSDAGLISPLYK